MVQGAKWRECALAVVLTMAIVFGAAAQEKAWAPSGVDFGSPVGCARALGAPGAYAKGHDGAAGVGLGREGVARPAAVRERAVSCRAPSDARRARREMALTRSFKDTVKARVERDAEFRDALLAEGINALLAGDMDTGKAMLRDYARLNSSGFSLGRRVAAVLSRPRGVLQTGSRNAIRLGVIRSWLFCASRVSSGENPASSARWMVRLCAPLAPLRPGKQVETTDILGGRNA